jgi:hypothetical protein
MSQFGELEQELSLIWRSLQGEWFQTRETWRDRVAEDFERQWWDELESEIPPLIAAVSEMDASFRQIDMFLAD